MANMMHRIKGIKGVKGLCWYLMGILGLLLGNTVHGQNSGEKEQLNAQHNEDLIKIIKNNRIPLLNNRFRIDDKVKEITLLFFRKRGTPPVILVQPNGKKLYASMAVTGEVEWYDEATYDLIRLENPMPGPWQAVGELSEQSKVIIVTDFELNVDDLPKILIKDETIKLSGYISNNGEKLEELHIKDVINLDVFFSSTNNAEFDNYGAGVIDVTSFKDDGKDFDERPYDGVFTGEFVLDFSAGEWVPRYTVRTPLKVRELVFDPVIVYPNPVSLSITPAETPKDYHLLTIDVKGDYIRPETLIFQGKVYYPNTEVQSFSITENLSGARHFDIVNYDFGIYRVVLSAYGEDANGREFMLSVPEFSFVIDPTPIVETADPRLSDEQIMDDENELLTEDNPVQTTRYVSLIVIAVIGNLLFILIVVLMVRQFVFGKSLLPQLSTLQLKFKGLFKTEKKSDEAGDKSPTEKPEVKAKHNDNDILELSSPD